MMEIARMRNIVRWTAGLLLAAAAVTAHAAALQEVLVYKSPTCGCCGSWVDHMKASGFKVKVVEENDVTPIKQRFGVPGHLASCHTALVGGYVVEGHVPASAVKRLLKERPTTVGVSVPGMPIGSPGMEGPNPEPFSTQLFDERGRARVYESHRPPYRW
ncbi:MAG: DUF411 domain-containing protein [Burkholderiales bacterium]|nr:DUF411 domain-containing protein [Burkholderiales bacterium]